VYEDYINKTPYNFKLFVDDDIYCLTVTETNKYMSQKLRHPDISPKSHLCMWRDRHSVETGYFLSVLLWMGLVNYEN